MTALTAVLSGMEGDRLLVVSAATTDVEREAVRAAVDASGSRAEIVQADDPTLSRRLDDGDVVLLPARVSWLAGRDGGSRRADLRELLTLQNPRRPRARSQATLMATQPERHRVIAGEPARVGDLRARWERETGGGGGPAEFARYVRRRGTVALERSEREIIGERYKTPQLVVEEICDSARFQQQVASLARSLHRPEKDVLDEATRMLEKVVATHDALAIDAFDTLTAPLYRKAWRLDVDLESLEPLRELNRSKGLVFLPSHRSYADPLIMSRVLDDAGFPRNHTPGGNNLSFWPVGPLGRRAGIIWIPRTLQDDPVAKLVLREYLGFLAAKRFNLEWYMEAGRSRTGKLRPPRFGLLQYVVEAMRSGRVSDVALVPVSIIYDRLPEIGLMAAEEQGLPKQAEGLSWMANYIRTNAHLLGTAFVRFGEPLSLRDHLDAAEQQGRGHRLAMQKVGFEVFNRINAVTPITPMSLVTLALLGVGSRALTVAQVREVAAPFVSYLDQRGLPLTDRAGVVELHGISQTLSRLEDGGIVSEYTGGAEPVYAIDAGQHHAAAFYRNGAIHWFVNRAIVEVAIALAMSSEDSGDDPVQAGWQECLGLRELLKFEFFFSDKRTFYNELLAERTLLGMPDDASLPTRLQDARGVLADAGFLAAPVVLRPFLEAYVVVSECLAACDPRRPIDQKAFIAECRALGQQYLLQHRLRNPESVSPELYASALKLVASRDLYDPGRDEVAAGRQALADEVARALHALALVDQIDREHRSGVPLGAGS